MASTRLFIGGGGVSTGAISVPPSPEHTPGCDVWGIFLGVALRLGRWSGELNCSRCMESGSEPQESRSAGQGGQGKDLTQSGERRCQWRTRSPLLHLFCFFLALWYYFSTDLTDSTGSPYPLPHAFSPPIPSPFLASQPFLRTRYFDLGSWIGGPWCKMTACSS